MLRNRKTYCVIWVYATALKLLLRLQPQKTFYDIDDADYLKFPPETIHHFLKNCSACIAGSQELVRAASEFNKNVLLLTSPVITHSYIKKGKNKQFTIGWVGYYNAHRKSLIELFFSALSNIGFPVRLIIMGVVKREHFAELENIFSLNKHITLVLPEIKDWQDEASIYKEISQFDIGIAPLLDSEQNRAKSAFKLKQYLSCGVPVLASDVGENSTFLQHGTNGYLCNCVEDYVTYIKHIAGMDDDNYSELAANALKTKDAFDMEHFCDGLLSCMSNFDR